LFGRWGPVVIAGAAVVVLLGTAAPALAEDPPIAPRAVAVPRGGRALPSGSSYEAVVTYAKDTARDLGALQQEARDVAAERIETATQIRTLAALTEKPSVVRGRLEREALRLSASARVPSPITLSEPVREAADEMRTLRTELKEQYVALEAEAVALAPYAALQAATHAWRSPLVGELTQGFGPTPYYFEPSRVYGGVHYSHFHEGIDIAAPMYSPVVAAAPGRVVWAGHLPDGAMVVLIAHSGGLVSLYAHLDDGIAAPRVAAGDQVYLGQIIGAVGMTGMTTGAHLHFVVWRDGELVDPLSVIAP
jgi:murein DD-endopeptidase MepM/ murein hydrolase activator NlpD